MFSSIDLKPDLRWYTQHLSSGSKYQVDKKMFWISEGNVGIHKPASYMEGYVRPMLPNSFLFSLHRKLSFGAGLAVDTMGFGFDWQRTGIGHHVCSPVINRTYE